MLMRGFSLPLNVLLVLVVVVVVFMLSDRMVVWFLMVLKMMI